jgi:hypothetical protein
VSIHRKPIVGTGIGSPHPAGGPFAAGVAGAKTCFGRIRRASVVLLSARSCSDTSVRTCSRPCTAPSPKPSRRTTASSTGVLGVADKNKRSAQSRRSAGASMGEPWLFQVQRWRMSRTPPRPRMSTEKKSDSPHDHRGHRDDARCGMPFSRRELRCSALVFRSPRRGLAGLSQRVVQPISGRFASQDAEYSTGSTA